MSGFIRLQGTDGCGASISHCLQVTRYAAAHGTKYVALTNYEGFFFGMFCAPNELLLTNVIKYGDTEPSVLEVRTAVAALPNK